MPVAVQQALETLAKPPVTGPAPTSESAPSLEFQLLPQDEQANAPGAAAGPAPTSAPVNQTPKAVKGAPPAGLAEAVAAQSSVPAATASLSPGSGPTQTQVPPKPPLKPDQEVSTAIKSEQPAGQLERTEDRQVERTQCATCGGFHSSLDGPALHGCLTCGGQNCVPGQKPCYPLANECNTVIGGFFTNLYQEICCPDPCYQPKWDPAAYASFFADYARPRTVTRIRYDNLEDMTRPDRNQFWIYQVNPKGRSVVNPRARLQQVSLYQEAAGERGSFFVEYPYRQINSNWEPTQAGFGDVNFGIKSLLFDCEMLQVTFQMRTYMPSGNFTSNLGTGQFVVDPSILTSLKLSPTTYFQGQFGNWVPVGGPGTAKLMIPARYPDGKATVINDGNLAGGIFYWLMSLNQVLWYCTPDSPLIATLEMDGWSFENGGYTTVVRQPGNQHYSRADGGGVSYFNIGPGLRQSICNRLDFGGAITWATDTAHWAQPWFRFEVRFLF